VNVTNWPSRLHQPPDRLQSIKMDASISRQELVRAESKYWKEIIDSYVHAFGWRGFNLRNVMDMRAGFGGYGSVLFLDLVFIFDSIVCYQMQNDFGTIIG